MGYGWRDHNPFMESTNVNGGGDSAVTRDVLGFEEPVMIAIINKGNGIREVMKLSCQLIKYEEKTGLPDLIGD